MLYLQNMNTSGFRACVKELYGTRYDPLSVSYAVLTGLLILVTVFIYWVCPPYVLTNEAYQQINLKTIRLLIHLRFFFFSEEYFTGKDTTLCSNLKHQASNKRLRSLCCLRIHFYLAIFLPSGWHHSNCPGNVFIFDHFRISLAIVLRLRCR